MSESKSKLELAFEKIKEAGAILASKETKVEMQAEANLENGQKIMTPSDNWAAGVEAYLVPEEGEPVLMEPGSYDLQNGGSITIAEGGVVEALQLPEGGEEVEGGMKPEEIEAVADKVIEKLGLSKESFEFDVKAEIEKRDEALEKLSAQVLELSKPAVEESEQKKNLAKTEKKSQKLSKEQIAQLSSIERLALKMNQYKS